jgi:hypothetical protein
MDTELWMQIQLVMPKVQPALPEEATSDKYYLGKINDYDIYIVDGDFIKIKWMGDFTEGGNFCVYGPGNSTYPDLDFIPDHEIWVDGRISIHELSFILYHELIEVRFMLKGLKYDDAHEIANAYEKEARIHYTLKNQKEKIRRNPSVGVICFICDQHVGGKRKGKEIFGYCDTCSLKRLKKLRRKIDSKSG